MTRKTEPPTIVKTHDVMGVETTHPAYGVVELTRPQGGGVDGGRVMFGSELRHNETMRLYIRRASSYRGLSDDRHMGRELICSLEFTLSQWAQFVSSQGIGAGTPCTLGVYSTGPLIEAPEITPGDSLTDKFKEEMEEAVSERLVKIGELLATAADMIETGAGKVKLREAISEARRHAQQLPGSVAFVQKQFTSAMDDVKNQAKTEIEGFVVGMALRTGIESLRSAAPTLLVDTNEEQPK